MENRIVQANQDRAEPLTDCIIALIRRLVEYFQLCEISGMNQAILEALQSLPGLYKTVLIIAHEALHATPHFNAIENPNLAVALNDQNVGYEDILLLRNNINAIILDAQIFFSRRALESQDRRETANLYECYYLKMEMCQTYLWSIVLGPREEV